MSKPKKNMFEDVVTTALSASSTPDVEGDKKPNAVDRRLDDLQRKQRTPHEGGIKETLAKTVVQRQVDPAVCRMWEHHNREYDLLNEQRCASLIKDIKEKGQQIPAIVRELHADPKYTYEVICGARRHWVAALLGKELLIEVRALTDEKAFLLSDSENREREDISDYERGLDYKKARELYYPSTRQMAAALGMDEKWLRAYLALAKLPQEILDAYASLLDVRVTHALKLTQIFETDETREVMLQKAKQLAGSGKKGAVVYRELCEVVAPQRQRGGRMQKTYRHKGKDVVTYKKSPRGGTQLLFHKVDIGQEELEKVVLEALREQWK